MKQNIRKEYASPCNDTIRCKEYKSRLKCKSVARQITLPTPIWNYIDEYMRSHYFIRSKSDSIISIILEAHPELKDKLNEEVKQCQVENV